MITVDLSSIHDTDDEIYSVERGDRGRLFKDGIEVRDCLYTNVTKGVSVVVKRTLEGNVVIADGCVVHELIFGSFAFEPSKPE